MLGRAALWAGVAAIFIGIGSVHKEIDKRSLYAVLSKPVRRWPRRKPAFGPA